MIFQSLVRPPAFICRDIIFRLIRINQLLFLDML